MLKDPFLENQQQGEKVSLKVSNGVIDSITREDDQVIIHVKGVSKNYIVVATADEAKANHLKVGDDIKYTRKSSNFGRFKAKCHYRLHH